MSIKKEIIRLSRYEKLTEQDFISVFNRFDVKEALCTLGYLSKKCYDKKFAKEHRLLQFILAYYSNIFLLTKPYRQEEFKIDIHDIHNMNVLYIEKLNEKFPEDNELLSFFIRTYYEQFTYGVPLSHIIGRNYLMYLKYNDIKELNDIFLNQNSIDIYTYFKLAFYFFTVEQVRFTPEEFNNWIGNTDANLKIDDVQNFIKMLSLDIKSYKALDIELKSYIKSDINDKNKFNLLKKYPLVKINKDYILANTFLFLSKVFDLFWWFEDYFAETNDRMYFRNNYFKDMFETYVRNVLDDTYGKNSIKKLKYKKNNSPAEFFDMYYIESNIAYLFEVKAYRYNLNVMNSGDIRNEVYKRFIEPKIQCYKRIKDFYSNKYDELNVLKDKTLMPIIIYYDIPFCDSNMYDDYIKEELDKNKNKILKLIDEKSLDNFLNFRCYNLSIRELEVYYYINKKNISLYKCLTKNETKFQVGQAFMQTVRELVPEIDDEGGEYLSKAFNEYTKNIFVDCNAEERFINECNV